MIKVVLGLAFIIVAIGLILFFLKKYVLALQKYEDKRLAYVKYLFSKKDFDGLRKIGEIDMFGKFQRVYPNYNSLKKFLVKQNENDKSSELIQYISAFKVFTKEYLLYIGGSILLISGIYMSLSLITRSNVILMSVMFLIVIPFFLTAIGIHKKYEKKLF